MFKFRNQYININNTKKEIYKNSKITKFVFFLSEAKIYVY